MKKNNGQLAMSNGERPGRISGIEVENSLKTGIDTVCMNGLIYIVGPNSKPIRFKAWLGDSLSFLYDFLMAKTVFPKTLGADMAVHNEVLRRELGGFREMHILELATGSGITADLVDNSNFYTGSDISPGLLKRAVKRFYKAGFVSAEFYLASADDLPFADSSFDICLCILSLNFFGDVPKLAAEINRILKPGSVFFCCVPVPERNERKSKISGRLYSENELQRIFNDAGFDFEPTPDKNGALLYFKAKSRIGGREN